MLQYFSERPYLYLIMIVLIALTVFVFVKAGQASKRHSRETAEIMKRLKEENVLRNEFSILSETVIASSEPARLFQGTALCLEKRVADNSDMLSEFNSLTEEQKYIYSLYYVYTDSADSLSKFFSANGMPLTEYADKAMKEIFGNELSDIFDKEYNAYDDNNESVSLIPAQIKELDERYSKLFDKDEFCTTLGKYIVKNKEKFI